MRIEVRRKERANMGRRENKKREEEFKLDYDINFGKLLKDTNSTLQSNKKTIRKTKLQQNDFHSVHSVNQSNQVQKSVKNGNTTPMVIKVSVWWHANKNTHKLKRGVTLTFERLTVESAAWAAVRLPAALAFDSCA